MEGIGTKKIDENIVPGGEISSVTSEVLKERPGIKNFPSMLNKFPVENLLRNELLAAQTDKSLINLLPYFKSVSLASGENLYKPGDAIDFVYFPETAVISEYQILEDGATAEIAMIGREGALGILSLLGARQSVNWSSVSVYGTAYKIKSEILKELVLCDHSFQKSVFRYIEEYTGQISRRAVCNNFHSLEQRFCGWLLMLQARKKSRRIALTQEQIAALLGVYRPSFTLTAQELKRKKIIDYRRGNIFILNRPELEQHACNCYREIDRNSTNYL